jgi:hypothetical protein
VFNGSGYQSLDDPLATFGTAAGGMSGNLIVGNYIANPFNYHGFAYDGSKFTTLNDPLATATGGTFATGVSNRTIVGYYVDGTGNHGFAYDGSSYTTLNDPLGVKGTQINGISGNTIVGTYADSSNLIHGFMATIPEPQPVWFLASAALLVFARRRRVRPSAREWR